MHLIEEKENWTKIIEPAHGWFNFNLRGLWRYRDLILLFVKRDFTAIYKQTILGPLWFLLQPLFSTIVFTVIFGRIAHIPTDGIPPVLFYMAGIVSWNYFSTCMTNTANTFTANAAIFGKVYFPRLTVPISVIILNLATFTIQFVLFLCFLAYFILRSAPVTPSLWVMITPFLLLQTGILGMGIGIIVSSMTTKYRDLSFLVGFGTQLWMYATPIVYPMSQIPPKWQWLYAFNPMAVVVETFRTAYLGGGAIRLGFLAVSAAITVAVFSIGIMLFSRIEKTFMDTV